MLSTLSLLLPCPGGTQAGRWGVQRVDSKAPSILNKSWCPLLGLGWGVWREGVVGLGCLCVGWGSGISGGSRGPGNTGAHSRTAAAGQPG